MARTSEVDPECEAAGSASQGVALPVSMSAPTTVGAMAGSPVCFLPHQYQILWLWYLPNREKPPRRPRQRGRHRPRLRADLGDNLPPRRVFDRQNTSLQREVKRTSKSRLRLD